MHIYIYICIYIYIYISAEGEVGGACPPDAPASLAVHCKVPSRPLPLPSLSLWGFLFPPSEPPPAPDPKAWETESYIPNPEPLDSWRGGRRALHNHFTNPLRTTTLQILFYTTTFQTIFVLQMASGTECGLSDRKVSCKPVRCPAFPAVANAAPMNETASWVSGGRFGDTLSYRCAAGPLSLTHTHTHTHIHTYTPHTHTHTHAYTHIHTHTLRCRSSTLHPTPYTLHPTPYTLHPTPYTLHPTPCTLHPTPYTLHPTPNTQHPTPYTRTLTPTRTRTPGVRANNLEAVASPLSLSHSLTLSLSHSLTLSLSLSHTLSLSHSHSLSLTQTSAPIT